MNLKRRTKVVSIIGEVKTLTSICIFGWFTRNTLDYYIFIGIHKKEEN